MHAMPEYILVAVSQLTEHALNLSAEQWLVFFGFCHLCSFLGL